MINIGWVLKEYSRMTGRVALGLMQGRGVRGALHHAAEVERLLIRTAALGIPQGEVRDLLKLGMTVDQVDNRIKLWWGRP